MKVLLMHRDMDFELYELPLTNRYARRQEPDRNTLLRAILVECAYFDAGLGIEHAAAHNGGRRRIRVCRGTASDSLRVANDVNTIL